MGGLAAAVEAPRLMQRLSALERANEIRLARAGLKRRIATRETDAASVLLAIPDYAVGWAIGEMLIAQPRWGATRVRKFLIRNMVGEMKPLGQLTERQCRVMVGQLGGSR